MQPNPWYSLYQHTGLSPSFGSKGGPGDEMLPAGFNGGSGQAGGSGEHRDGAARGSSVQRGVENTSRANCGSVFEYLATRSPRNSQHLRFSGSRLGARDKGHAILDGREQVEIAEVTPSTIMYQRTAAEYGKHTRKKKHMTPEEAREYLDHAQHNPLKPPRTYWESDSVRQVVIDSLGSEVRPEDAPGGSWVLRPGTMPPARAMMRPPDKMTALTTINPERRKLMANLRWQLYVKNIFTHDQLIAVFRKIDLDNSHHVPLTVFFEIIKSFELELTASRADTFEQMFCSVAKPGYVDYEDFVYTLMDATEHVPKPRTDVLGGAEAVIRNRSSSIFNGLNSLRPKSRSGRFHTFTDMRNSMERPLVIPSGNQATRGMYQFMSDREAAILHNYRDRDPLRNSYKPDYVSPEIESADLPGRSLPKRVPTPDGLQRPLPNVAANSVEELASSRETETPAKARGRSVDFMPEQHEEGPANPQHGYTPRKGEDSQVEIRSPNNVEDAFTNFGYYQHRTPRASPGAPASPDPSQLDRLNSQPGSPGSPSVFDDRWTASPPQSKDMSKNFVKPPNKRSPPKPRAVAAAKPIQLRPPAWDVTWRHEVRKADMLTKLAHTDPEGQNLPSAWDTTNQCNKDIPGGEAARAELKETLALNQKMNASKRLTNWSYAHGGNELEPVDWRSTAQDQMHFRSRLRTPKKHVIENSELRTPPWSVAERHEVHLMKYDHRLVGLRRPEPLAKGSL